MRRPTKTRHRSEIAAHLVCNLRIWLVLLVAAAANAPHQVAAQQQSAGTAKPPLNILVVLSDDHSYPHVGAYSNPDIKTPHLDKFAQQAMRFDRAYVAAPQCVPSRAAIMSGRSPIGTQMTRFTAPLPAEVKVFPELLRAAGYYSGVAGRTYHLDGARVAAESSRVFDAHALSTFPKRLDYVKTTGSGPNTVAQFREFLSLVPKGKAFVLQLCFSDPHRPLDKDAIPEPHDPQKLKLPAHYIDTPQVRQDFANYYDEIARFDNYFGEVMKELEARKIADNTIVLFMGDNGASQLRGKGTLYEFGIHVPLLVRWPSQVKPGSSTSELISGEDIAPTMLEAAGIAVLKEMTGRSFVKLLKGEQSIHREFVFAERGAHGSALPNNTNAFDLARCVVTKKYKLIYNALWQLPYTPVDFNNNAFWKELQQMNAAGKLSPEMSRIYFAPQRQMFELYDLEVDPQEFNNLNGNSEVAAVEHKLKAALQEWMILERDYVPLPINNNNR